MKNKLLKTFVMYALLILVLCGVETLGSTEYKTIKLLDPDATGLRYHLWVQGELVYTLLTNTGTNTTETDKPIDILKPYFKGYKNYSIGLHGFCPNGLVDWYPQFGKVVSAKDGVIIMVDWSARGAMRPLHQYAQTAAKITTQPESLAFQIVKDLATPELKLTTCFGHSLGAHQCGCIGRLTHLDKIWGLDPAGVLFSSSPNKLGTDSADLVIQLATSKRKNIFSVSLGIQQALGHVNFWFNWEGNRGTDSDCFQSDSSTRCNHQAGTKALIGMYKSNKTFNAVARPGGVCESAFLTRNYTGASNNFLVKTYGYGAKSFNLFNLTTDGDGGKLTYTRKNTRNNPEFDLHPSYCATANGYLALIRGIPRTITFMFDNSVIPNDFVLQHKLKPDGRRQTQYIFQRHGANPKHVWVAMSHKTTHPDPTQPDPTHPDPTKGTTPISSFCRRLSAHFHLYGYIFLLAHFYL